MRLKETGLIRFQGDNAIVEANRKQREAQLAAVEQAVEALKLAGVYMDRHHSTVACTDLAIKALKATFWLEDAEE